MRFYQKGLGVGFLLLGLAFTLPCPAHGQTVQVLSQGCGTGKPSPGSNTLFVDTSGNLCTGAGGGSATNGSITAAGTNGTVAQAVQGITGGVPVTVSAAVPKSVTFSTATTTAVPISSAVTLFSSVTNACDIVNGGTVVVFFTQSGTATANSIPLQPGQAYHCPRPTTQAFSVFNASASTAGSVSWQVY